MGFFSKLVGKKQEEPKKKSMPISEIKQDKITRSVSEDGKLNCNFLNGREGRSTSIIVNPNPIVVNSMPVYEVSIEWYGDESDTFYFDTNSHGNGFETVYAGIDLNQLQNDDEYLKYTLEALLKEERVRNYLKMAMKTEEEINREIARTGDTHIYPCGRYVGNVRQINGRFSKTFNCETGKWFHNSPQMKKEREKYRAEKEKQTQEKIDRKKAEIDRLSKEIDEEENRRD